MPVSTVADGDLITPAWGNSVSSSIAALEGSGTYHPGGTDVAVADGGTGASTAAAAATNLGLGTGDSPQHAGLNVGHATDTTLTRLSAGDLAVEGNRLFRVGGADVPVADGGTGASTAAAAATNLGIQHARLTAGAIAAGATADVTISWPSSFGDTNYTACVTASDVNVAGVSKITCGIKIRAAGSILVTVFNGDTASRTPLVNAIGIHD